MGRLNHVVKSALVLLVLFNFGFTDCSNAPLFMWNIDTDISVNPLQVLETNLLVDQLAQTTDNKLIVVFIQDELSVEDFKSESLASLKSLAELSAAGFLYVPSVSDPESIPGLLESKGFKLVQVKSHQDLPTDTENEKVVLVVDLPSTWSEDVRRENLELNANVIAQVYEVLKSQQSNVVGIFTAKENTKAQESKIRVARAANKEVINKDGGLFNVSGEGYLFFEAAPLLKYIQNGKNMNFTLNDVPDSKTSVVNGLEAEFVLTYDDVKSNGDTNVVLKKAEIKITFGESLGYWVIKKADLRMSIDDNGKPIEFNQAMKPGDVVSPLRFSYHCTPKTNLISYGIGNGNVNGTGDMAALEMNGFQLQPFGIKNEKFGDWYDCQGFFTEGIWAGILLGLVIAMMLAWAVGMLADVRTPDRFDDPKGKTITITATD